MAETQHLTHAPITEALIQFQANAAERWDPERLRRDLGMAWPLHTNVQANRSLKVEVKHEHGKDPEQSVSFSPPEGLVFRAEATSTVYQARRDGLVVSWLPPYIDWETFRGAALDAWDQFQRVANPEALHSVAVRYLNRLEFPLEGFRMKDYFTAPPAKPPEISDWNFHGFLHRTFFEVPDSFCAVLLSFSPTFEGAPEKVAFLIDIEVRLKEPLSAIEFSKEEVLEQMRHLKNKTFFSMLTPAAVERYT
jgi:uncharacterized protein (TIGR04255 family)